MKKQMSGSLGGFWGCFCSRHAEALRAASSASHCVVGRHPETLRAASSASRRSLLSSPRKAVVWGITVRKNFCVAGFTLIELLVVVLIIGILAAIAVPQYQKAVEKSRGTQALTLMNSFAQAVSSYYMANGTYPASFDELDIDVPSGWTGKEKWSSLSMLDTKSNGEWSLQLYKTEGGYLRLYIGRLTGKYKGGGFVQFVVLNNELSENIVECAERKRLGIVFTGPAGSYCQGIWKATFDGNDASSFRVYKMP